ncbi:hypothetical protein GCM10011504_58900 [Siccirubricoccus deserti]|uniref:Uncharacterized protein n=1 Tax=Siccirubricoccus deserti TaxID=2013562 RepID=A0A9X0R3S5_9PROT|nr:hypothetical protein [Siccirubricoccus deserti]MBC4019386.1 hypothetical protein [Siccirubricoccus deserti]GGC73865.1 hypothetical protein GCM10011504_58900 [Siccirubricoccus deserti]
MNAISDIPKPARLPGTAGLTFADAIVFVKQWDDRGEDIRRQRMSALHTAARILKLPPETIPCDVTWLNQRLFVQPAAAHGITHGRFQNVMAGLRDVLRRLGLHRPDLRGEAGLPEAWLRFLEGATAEAQRAGLRAFARFCAEKAMLPEQVTNATLAAYLEDDQRTRLSVASTRHGAHIARAWNRIRDNTPNLVHCLIQKVQEVWRAC